MVWTDRGEVLKALNENGWLLKNVDKSLQHEEDILEAAANSLVKSLKKAGWEVSIDELKEGDSFENALPKARLVLVDALSADGWKYRMLPSEIRQDLELQRMTLEFVVNVLQEHGFDVLEAELRSMPPREDTAKNFTGSKETEKYEKDILVAAQSWLLRKMNDYFWQIDDVPSELRFDGKEDVLGEEAKRRIRIALEQDGWRVRFLPRSLKADVELVALALQTHGAALSILSEEMKGDRELVLLAVASDGIALQYTAPGFRADPDIVTAAVKQHGLALELAVPELRADKDVVLAAVRQHGWALQYAAEDLRNDPDIVFAALRQTGSARQFALGAAASDMQLYRDARKEAQAEEGNALAEAQKADAKAKAKAKPKSKP